MPQSNFLWARRNVEVGTVRRYHVYTLADTFSGIVIVAAVAMILKDNFPAPLAARGAIVG